METIDGGNRRGRSVVIFQKNKLNDSTMMAHLQQLQELYPWPLKTPSVSKWNIFVSDTTKTDDLFPSFFHEDAILILEIGSDIGMATQDLLKKAPEAVVICLDHWNGRNVVSRENMELYETFLKNLWEKRNRVIPLRCKPCEGLKTLREYGMHPEAVYCNKHSNDWEHFNEINRVLSAFPETTLYGNNVLTSGIHSSLKTIAKQYHKQLIAENGQWILHGESV